MVKRTGTQRGIRPSESIAVDERRLGRWASYGLPLATVILSSAAALLLGAASAILIVAAGLALGVIAFFWASLRVLCGDVLVDGDLDARVRPSLASGPADALLSRKTMFIRALKDLENEHALGKLETDDYEQLSYATRQELRDVLLAMDSALAPYRAKAEAAAHAHLAKIGLVDGQATLPENRRRLRCSKCSTSNESDATFCKQCGLSLSNTGNDIHESSDAS